MRSACCLGPSTPGSTASAGSKSAPSCRGSGGFQLSTTSSTERGFASTWRRLRSGMPTVHACSVCRSIRTEFTRELRVPAARRGRASAARMGPACPHTRPSDLIASSLVNTFGAAVATLDECNAVASVGSAGLAVSLATTASIPQLRRVILSRIPPYVTLCDRLIRVAQRALRDRVRRGVSDRAVGTDGRGSTLCRVHTVIRSQHG